MNDREIHLRNYRKGPFRAPLPNRLLGGLSSLNRWACRTLLLRVSIGNSCSQIIGLGMQEKLINIHEFPHPLKIAFYQDVFLDDEVMAVNHQ